jgi:hypothetical protein
MSKQFDALVTEARDAERELRALTPGKPSLRCFIAECLERADANYSDVEQLKERLTDPMFGLTSGCATFIRDLARQIANGKFPGPPEKRRVGALYFNQKDQAIMELGGQPISLVGNRRRASVSAAARCLRQGRGPRGAQGADCGA